MSRNNFLKAFNGIRKEFVAMGCSENSGYSIQQMALLKAAIDSEKDIVLFGIGEIGNLVRKYFQLRHLPVSIIIDNNSAVWGKRKGLFIVSPKEGVNRYPHAVYVIASMMHGQNMRRQLVELGVCENNIIVCSEQGLIRNEIEKYLNMKREDKYFIFDYPCEYSIRYFISELSAKIKSCWYKSVMNAWHPKNARKKRYDVSICAIFKNEADYLKEWIVYHKLIGVNHFYLYNNFSSDSFREVLEPYISAGIVSLIDWPYEQGQLSAYKDCVLKYKSESRWIGFIDLDEFVVPIDNDSLYDFLKKFEKNRGSVILYWKLFGSSGKIERDISRLVTEDFILCWRKHSNIGKCFFNTAYDFIPEFSENDLMHHKMWTGYKGIALPPVNCFDRVCLDGFNYIKGDHFPIQINHYFTKSLSEWESKQRKGDVFFKKNPHDEKYFLQHDMKCSAVDVSVYKYLVPLKRYLAKKTQ